MAKTTTDHQELTPEYATFRSRLYATAIDMLLSLPILLLLKRFSSVPEELVTLQERYHKGDITPEQYQIETLNYFMNGGGFESFFTDSVIEFVLAGAVIIFFWMYRSATPGKMFFHMKVVDKTTLAKPCTSALFIRYIAYIPSFLFLGLGFIWIAFNKKRQGWHDMIAGTVVIYTRPHDADWKEKQFKRNSIIGTTILAALALWMIYNYAF